MKIYYLNLFSILAICTLLILKSGCKKTEEEASAPICLLTKLIYDDESTEFYYDENNRLIKFIFDYPDTSFYYSIQYNSDGKMITYSGFSSDGRKQTERTFLWSENEVTMEDSYLNNDGNWELLDFKDVYLFDSENQVVKEEWYYNLDGDWRLSYYVVNEWVGGNIKKKEYWSLSDKIASRNNFLNTIFNHISRGRIDLKFNRDDFELIRWTTFQYDNKKHPYSSLKTSFLLVPITNNNVTNELTTLDSGNHTELTSYTYKYNELGFPTFMRQTDSDGSTHTYNLEYNCE